MSVKDPHASNVLPFPRVNKRAPQLRDLLAELRELLVIYDQLIVLLRATDDDGLDVLTDGLVGSVVRCREAMAAGLEEEQGTAMIREMRAGLHEIPRVLRSLLPGLGPRLGESMEHKLGIQFAKFE